MHGSPSPAPPNLLSGGLLTLAISLTVPPLLLAPDLKHWSTDYSDCGGTKQSPINVDAAQAIFSPDLRPIQLSGYSLPANKQLKLKNNGHTGGGRGNCRAGAQGKDVQTLPAELDFSDSLPPGSGKEIVLQAAALLLSRPKGKRQAVEILQVRVFSWTR